MWAAIVASVVFVYIVKTVYVFLTSQCDMATRTAIALADIPDFVKNKKILITGASSGIGRAVARHLSKIAVEKRLFLTARRKHALDAVADECRNACTEVHVISCDLTDAAAIAALWNDIRWVDVLILNAGDGVRELSERIAPDANARVLGVNLASVIELVRLALPGMKRQRSGSIAVIGSLVSRMAVPGYATYVATKHALLGFVESLRLELVGCGFSRIEVSMMLPGAIKTDVVARDKAHGADSSYIDKHFDDAMDVDACASLIVGSLACGSGERWFMRGCTLEQLGIYLAYYVPWIYKFFVETKAKELCAEFRDKKRHVHSGHVHSGLCDDMPLN